VLTDSVRQVILDNVDTDPGAEIQGATNMSALDPVFAKPLDQSGTLALVDFDEVAAPNSHSYLATRYLATRIVSGSAVPCFSNLQIRVA
jgi:hypothetical protein